MKTPDKIYFHPDFEGSQTPSVFGGIEKRGSHPEECVEYIRKDALIKWAKEHQEGERQGSYTWSCYQIFIDKLNSM